MGKEWIREMITLQYDDVRPQHQLTAEGTQDDWKIVLVISLITIGTDV